MYENSTILNYMTRGNIKSENPSARNGAISSMLCKCVNKGESHNLLWRSLQQNTLYLKISVAKFVDEPETQSTNLLVPVNRKREKLCIEGPICD